MPRLRFLLLPVIAAACQQPDETPDGCVVRDVPAGVPRGVLGVAGFVNQVDNSLIPIAAGGAQSEMVYWTNGCGPVPTTLLVSDPASLVPVGFVPGIAGTIKLKSGLAGTSTITLSDANGVEIDHIVVTIADSADLGYPPSVDGATVLAGAIEKLHVVTLDAQGRSLAGDGAVTFATGGILSPASAKDAPWFFSDGDVVFFHIDAAGAGTITASAPAAQRMVSVTAVDTSALTAIDAQPNGPSVQVKGLAGTTPVYGARCTWTTDAPNVTVTLGQSQLGELGADAAFTYDVSGPPGTHALTCTMRPGLSATVQVTLR